jgi:hypothetical protein
MKGLRPVPIAAGVIAIAIFARMWDVYRFGGTFGLALGVVSANEAFFWLCHLALVVPGALLIAYGVVPALGPRLAAAIRRIDAFEKRQWRLAAVGYGVVLLALAAVGRGELLLDLPITDDENAVRFGAQMMAEGALMVPELEPAGVYSDLFLYHRDGYVMSMDFPGTLGFAALAQLTGLGSWLYAFLAAGSGVAVAHAAARLWGARACVVAALLWMLSPMVLTLSLTTHAHLASRAFVALAVACYARVVTSERKGDALLLGLSAGLALLLRPFEAVLLLAPLGAHLAIRFRRALLVALAPLALSLVVFAWYNAQTTGVWYLQARFAGVEYRGVSSLELTPWDRLGGNLGFNLVMLLLWFFGPVGALLAWLGARRGGGPAIALASGLGMALAFALLHDNTGIHAVGPIHYSECAVPLTLLAAAGMLVLVERAGAAWDRAVPALLLAGYAVIGLGVFVAVQANALRRQALNQDAPFEAVRRAGIDDAIVFALPPARLYAMRPEMQWTRSWVLELPPPDPFLTDPVIYVKADADPAALRRRFPDRQLYVLVYQTDGAPASLFERDDEPE